MAESSAPAETIAHDDLCPICHLLIYDPIVTLCNHVLCLSCMAQWADVSSTTHIAPSALDLDLNDFDPNYDPRSDLSSLEANCPMCRTSTTASLNTNLRRRLETDYPATYAQRRIEEEEERGKRIGQDGVEGMTILIGNRHRLDRGGEEAHNKHDWTFFVRVSRPEIVRHVKVKLHPTFRPPSVTLRNPPFEVRRLGWGFFNIEAMLVLDEPYSWVQDGENATTRQSMTLDWMLNFDGRGAQGRVRAKVRRGDQRNAGEANDDARPRSPVRYPHMDPQGDWVENE